MNRRIQAAVNSSREKGEEGKTGEMTIENVINRSCINLHMKGRDKKEVIEEMAEMFDRAGVLVDKAGYIKAVYERESEGPTGIGDQVAIPHGKTAAVGKTAMAVRKTG